MDKEIYEHHVIFTGERWAVKPAEADIVATVDTQQEAIDIGYQLALEAGDELLVFDEQGALVSRIDPEDDLELAPHIVETIRQFKAGELEFFEYKPAKDTSQHVEPTVHNRDKPSSG
jgi:hypothetical protein